MENIRSTLKGKVIHSQGREIIANVYNFMKEEAENKQVTIPLAKARERTAAAVGVSERLVTKINGDLKKLKEAEDCETRQFSTPGKKRHNFPRRVTGLDDFDKCAVRRTIYNFHLQKKCFPTVKLLLVELRDSINFQGQKSSLKSIIKDLGFKWRKTENSRKLLIETQDIREKRIAYLRSVRRFRSEGRPIVYLDESYIHSTHMQSKSWADESNNGLRVPISKGDRLIIIHAGGEKGFIPNALKTWKASKRSGDYHDNVNQEMFMKWLMEKLLPNLEPRSVLVVDNASYHNVQVDKAPTSKSKKQEMKNWLSNHNIPYTDDMYVPELYQLIKLYKPRLCRYLLDETVQKEGHTVLRLPPYHPDLNPIELIWADVKGFVASKNVSCNFSQVQKITEDKIASMCQGDWTMKCEHVKKIENDYLANEGGIDSFIDSFVISLEDDSDSEETDEDDPDAMSGVEELE